jgi:hypothetical protein
MQLKLPLGVVEGRVELVRSMDATAIGSHHHVFPRVPKEAHHLMDVWTKFLRIAMRHDFVEDTGSAILHSANDIEPDPAGDTTPGAVRLPRLAFESLWVFALAWTQGTCRQAIALGVSPPACPEHGKAPQAGLIFREENALAPAGPRRKSSQFETSPSQISRIGIEPSCGTTGAQRIFFHTQRTLSRPSWTPVWWAKAIARSRQLPCEWREPCSRGS